MAQKTLVAVDVRERSQVAEARRRALLMANDIGLSEADAARAALVATEAATNLLRHAGQGEILIAPRADGDIRSVTIAALDSGPGMANPAECMEDGFTTGDGPGVGLGTIQRQSDMFELFSLSGQGTVVVATIHPRHSIEAPVAPQPFQPHAGGTVFGCFAVPAAGETACGDGWAVRRSAGITDILVCDGLGHGAKAAEATDAACVTFAAQTGVESLEESMERIDRALQGTRGAAVAIASIDHRRSLLSFMGVGNISGWLRWDGGTSRTLSYEGIVGRNTGRARVIEYPYEGELLAIFASDGLGTRWDLGKYRGLASRHPLTIGAVLYRDFRRRRDDCTVFTARIA